MFSTNQQTFLESFIPTILKSDYPYYIAYTNTNTSGSYQSTINDLFVLVSDEPIVAIDGYNYSLSGNCQLYSIRTANYSSSNYANNSERVTASEYTNEVLTIEMYEHIYTNAEFETIALQGDILSGVGETNVQIKSGNILIAVFLFVFLFLHMWQGRK